MFPTVYLMVIAFVQLGLSYWLSVGVLGSVIICFARKQNVLLLFNRHLVLRGAAAIAMPLAVAVSTGSQFEDILFACREGLFLFLITGCFYWRWATVDARTLAKLVLGITVFGILSLVFVAVQSISLRSGRYLGVPSDWFVSNQNTIPTELDINYGFLRPNGTFGEPSYLGGVCLTLIFALSPIVLTYKKARPAVAALAITTALSTSFSGMISIFLYLLQLAWKRIRVKGVVLAFFVVVFLILAIVLSTENEFSRRLDAILSGNDASAWTRIFAPLILLPEVFSHSLVGYPKSVWLNLGYIASIGVKADELGHNALLNLLIGYGVSGLLAIFTLFYCARGADKKLFVFLIASQNGALLAPDKFAILSFAFMVYNSLTVYQSKKVSKRLSNTVAAGQRPTQAAPVSGQ